MDLKGQLINELKQNEHILQIVSFEDLNKEYENKKNTAKTASGYVAPVLDAIGIAKIIREFGISPEKVLIKNYAGKQYVIFKGHAGQRNVLRGTRYLATNPKVVRMAIGPKGLIKSVKGGCVITVVLSVGIEVFDFFIRDSSTLSQLLGTVSADLVKIGLSTIAGAVAGMVVGGSAILGSVAAAPLIAAVAVGILTGLALNHLDEKFGATKALIKAYEQMGINLSMIAEEYRRGMNAIERNPQLIKCLFAPCGQYY